MWTVLGLAVVLVALRVLKAQSWNRGVGMRDEDDPEHDPHLYDPPTTVLPFWDAPMNSGVDAPPVAPKDAA
jgi:hypothetical protein